MTDSSTSRRRRGIPPPWALMLAGVVMFAIAGFRYAAETTRSWQASVVAGVGVILVGLVMAAVRRSFR